MYDPTIQRVMNALAQGNFNPVKATSLKVEGELVTADYHLLDDDILHIVVRGSDVFWEDFNQETWLGHLTNDQLHVTMQDAIHRIEKAPRTSQGKPILPMEAADVQQLIVADDKDEIAHGYDFERNTIGVYFEDGHLVKQVHNSDRVVDERKSRYFEPTWFTEGIKRWYEEDFNETLLQYILTFGGTPPLTKRGK